MSTENSIPDRHGFPINYRCIHIDCATEMFTPGKAYPAVLGEGAPAIIDDLGRTRVMGSFTQFIIKNDLRFGKGRVYYAYFKIEIDSRSPVKVNNFSDYTVTSNLENKKRVYTLCPPPSRKYTEAPYNITLQEALLFSIYNELKKQKTVHI